MMKIDKNLNTPYFLVDESLLRKNLEILRDVSRPSGCKILLAQKAYSMYYSYPIIREYLDGTTASGLYEARLGYEEFGGETHVYSPAYREDEFDQLLKYADTVVFNSPSQVKKYASKAKDAGKSIGLRVNPQCSTQKDYGIYDPCAPGSRLGTTIDDFDQSLLPFLDGLHFHTLCQQNSDDLEITVTAFEEKYGRYLKEMKWLNLGGGHHITRMDYDIQRLIRIIKHLRSTYEVEIYLEPGEAVVLNAGFLVSRILDIVHNEIDIAILDTSAECHMPDVIEMPYRPPIEGAGEANDKPYKYRLTGPTCLAGDIIGDYSFDNPLQTGDYLIFEDMALYTMVKTNTFNGIRLPDIVWKASDGNFHVVGTFGYEDFKSRLS